MSAQFGRWNFAGKPLDESYLQKVKSVISPYGPDGGSSYTGDHITILYHAFHTTKESHLETQPHTSGSGAIITLDGRLDNAADIRGELGNVLPAKSTDVEVVAAAYERWGTACLAKLVGDWALAVWDGRTRSLVLAKDFAGVRQLYYSMDKEQVTWSTILDPIIRFARTSFTLSEEYLAGWLSFNPAAELTPYVGVYCVPPSSFVLLRPEQCEIRKYWDFDSTRQIRYATDCEYEEHFRTVFGQAVRRRLRSEIPILAELSGGMDSSSIVCMADRIIASGISDTPRLDTISYYNDSEPNWNERPYFAKVEEKRGRAGCHINCAAQEVFSFDSGAGHFEATPGCTAGRMNKTAQQLALFIQAQGHRVVLVGVGGDEVMGGVPTPTPELQDMLARGQIKALSHQLKCWALNKKKPWLHLLLDALRDFLPPALIGVPSFQQPPSWLNPNFVRQNTTALEGYAQRLRLFGALPSFQANLQVLDNLRRRLACQAISSEPPYEKRYPYLDRCLLEFVYASPREQLLRVGQRRSLMRRALRGIVPHEILERKRKAFVSRGPRAAISAEWDSLSRLSQDMSSSSRGIVDQHSFLESLRRARNNEDVQFVRLIRTVLMEVWLRSLDRHEIVNAPPERSGDLIGCLARV